MYIDPFGKEHRYGPPAGFVRAEGQQSFSAKNEWEKIVARGLQFPDYNGPTDLGSARGTCLNPLLSKHHIYRTRPVAPDEQLVDGGLYIFECDWKNKDDQEKVKAYCAEMGVLMGEKNLIMKFLRYVLDEWYYVCNQGMGSLTNTGNAVVLAQVVEVLTRGALAYGARTAVCDTAEISANAVSTIISNFSAAVVSTNNNVTQGTGSSTDANVITAAVITNGHPMAIDVGATVTLTGGGSPGSSFVSGVLDVFMDGTSIGSAKWDLTNLANFGGGSTPPAIQVTLSATNTPSAGAHTYALHAHVAGTGSVWSCTIACVNNFIKVREIKR
jgi:hypothetical protein